MSNLPVGRAPDTAAPPVLARALALLAIMIAGLCGGLIGFAVTDLQCNDGCTTTAGIVGVVSAAGAAVGVAIVAVLTMRAMAEWKAQELQEQARRIQE
jgi:hypothetical protein